MVHTCSKHFMLRIYRLSDIFCLRGIFLRHRIHRQNDVRGYLLGVLACGGIPVFLYEAFFYNLHYQHDKHGNVLPDPSAGLGQLAAADPGGNGNAFQLFLL